MRTQIAALTLTLALTACGGHVEPVDESAVLADLQALGYAQQVEELPEEWYAVNRDLCDNDEFGFALTLAMVADTGGDLDFFRVGVEHMCPHRVDEFDEVTGDFTSAEVGG